MDTFSICPYEDMLPEIKSLIESAEPLAGNNSSIAIRYQDAMRFTAEAQQLYSLFDWNYRQLTNGIVIRKDDILISADGKCDESNYRIIVNGYTVNLVSSGINFIQALESFPNHIAEEQQNLFNSFHSFRSSTFDQNTLYALFYSMRNFAQHQQLLVSIHHDHEGFRACFDLDQLSSPFLYSFKAKESGILEKLKSMLNPYTAPPQRLAYCYSIDRFNVIVRSIYAAFLDSLMRYTEELRDELKREFFLHPNAFFYLPNGEKVAVYYIGDYCHLLTDLEHNPLDDIRGQQDELELDVKRAKEQLSRYKRGDTKRV